MSSVLKFDINSIITYKNNQYMIKSYPTADSILLKSIIKPYNEEIVKVNDLINNPSMKKENHKSLVNLTQDEFNEANKRFKIIEPLLKLDNRTSSDVLKIAKKHKKGIATIYRWLNQYEKHETVSSLSSNRDLRGGKGKSRLNEKVNKVLNDVIEDLYLNKQQYPLQDIYDQLIYRCNELNLKHPTKNTLRNRINNIHPKLIAKHRNGIRVNETRGMPNKFPEVKMPLDIIQIDHTKVDIILVDEETRQPIGRPFITVAIDVFSRMMYGFYISLEATNYFSVGQCLLTAILPKDDFLSKYDVKGDYPLYGLPRKIHMDNGADFRSISLQNFCQEYGIEDIYRPVARPEFGGAVERVIGTFMKKTHSLPGTTKSNIFDKRSYDSEAEASMTIDELEKWYLDFVVNVYHKTEHSSLGMTPEEKYYQGLFGLGEEKEIPFLPNVPQNTLKLRMSLLPEIKRTVQKNGITIDYITYFSEALRKWIIPTQYKKLKSNLKNEVICRRDPRDVSKLYVYDEDIKDYITVPYADIRKPKMNLSELRASIAEAKRLITGREIETHDVFEAKERLRQLVETTKKDKKSARRKNSSKKHQEKTLKNEKEIIDYKENDDYLESKKNYVEKYNDSNKVESDDEDDYEIYPIG